jgi:hypothetical protein
MMRVLSEYDENEAFLTEDTHGYVFWSAPVCSARRVCRRRSQKNVAQRRRSGSGSATS